MSTIKQILEKRKYLTNASGMGMGMEIVAMNGFSSNYQSHNNSNMILLDESITSSTAEHHQHTLNLDDSMGLGFGNGSSTGFGIGIGNGNKSKLRE